MLQRNISTDEVELILNEPDGMIKQSQDKFIFYKKLKGRKDNLIAAVTLVKSKDINETQNPRWKNKICEGRQKLSF